MSQQPLDRRKVGALERHIATIAQAIAALLLAWIGLTTHLSSVAIAELKIEFRALIKHEEVIYQSLEKRVAQAEDRLVNIASRIRDCEDRILGFESARSRQHMDND